MGTLTFASLAWTIVTNLCVFVACLVVFNVLRTWPISRMFYQPKRHLEIPWRVKPPRLSAASFAFGGWWHAIYSRTDEEILACAGQDALTYIRFLSFGFRLSLVVGLICMLTALPVNWIAGNAISCKDEEGNTVDNCSTAETGGLTNFDYTSLANIKNKSPFLWIHLVVVYVVSLAVMKMLWVMQKQAVTWRVKYLASTRKGAESHTILVQNIPGTLYGTLLQRIYQHMDGPFGFLIPRSVKAKSKAAIGGSFGKLGRIGQQVGTVAGKVPLGGAVKGSLVSNYATEPLDVYLDAELAVDHPANAEPSAAFAGSTHHTSVHLRGAHVFDNSAFSDVTDEKDAHHVMMPPHHNQQDGPDPSDHEAESKRFRSLQDRESSDERVTDFDTWAQASAALQRGISVQELVKREFQRTYPDVECVTVVKNQRGLSKLVETYDRTKQALEDLIDRWEMQMQAGTPIKKVMVSIKPPKLGGSAVAKWGSQPCKVEKSEFLTWKLMDSYQRLSEAQQTAEDTCSAFVTFRKRLTQVQAASALHYHNETYWTTEPASGPQEVVWDNIAYRGWERKIRFVLAWTLFIALTALFTIPVGFVQSMVNIKTLEKINGIETILNKPFLRGFITGVLPGLVMKIFLALVPSIIRFFNDIQGIYSHAQNDFEVGRKYFAFQYIQVFFIFIVGGSVYQNFSKASDDTAAFVKGFGQVIPSFANFYITYVLVSALIATPLGLMRFAGLAIYIILTLVYRGSERAKRRLWSRQYMRYGDDVPNHTLTIVILLTFCVMQPFIAIPCVMYFATASFVARYQLLYVFREAYQSGGRFNPIIFDQIVAALFTFQIGMFAVLSVKQFPYSPLLVLPIGMTAIFRAAVSASFDRPLANLSAHAAADLDRADVKRPGPSPAEEEEMMRTMDCEDTPLGPVSELYLSPCFKVSPQKYKAVLDEVVTVRAKLAVFEAGRPVVPHPNMPPSNA